VSGSNYVSFICVSWSCLNITVIVCCKERERRSGTANCAISLSKTLQNARNAALSIAQSLGKLSGIVVLSARVVHLGVRVRTDSASPSTKKTTFFSLSEITAQLLWFVSKNARN